MEQQDHESFFSPKGIPAFASIIIFGTDIHIYTGKAGVGKSPNQR